MDAHDRHVGVDYSHMMLGIAAIVIAISFAVLVCWLALSKQDSKLYMEDNVVCVSQPGALSCFERKK